MQLKDQLTIFETTMLLGIRCQQLVKGAEPLIQYSSKNKVYTLDDYEKIAELEIEAGLLPIEILRQVDGKTIQRVSLYRE